MSALCCLAKQTGNKSLGCLFLMTIADHPPPPAPDDLEYLSREIQEPSPGKSTYQCGGRYSAILFLLVFIRYFFKTL